jgi:hypothetical protein
MSETKRGAVPPIVRNTAYKAYGRLCGKCLSQKNIEVHHIFPTTLGGTDEVENLSVLCKKCHQDWHALDVDDEPEDDTRERFEQWLKVPPQWFLMTFLAKNGTNCTFDDAIQQFQAVAFAKRDTSDYLEVLKRHESRTKSLTQLGLQRAKELGRLGGRPKTFTDKKMREVEELVAQNIHSMKEISLKVGVGVSTIYRIMPAIRSRIHASSSTNV